MDVNKEKQLARGPYLWLRASPLLTVFTFYLVSNFGPADIFCTGNFKCDYNVSSMINALIGVLVSALWHLILLQYIRGDRGDLVRKHGMQALMYAGIRTAIPLGVVILDMILGAGGLLACWTIPILIILWVVNSNTGLKQVELDFPGSENRKSASVIEVNMTEENRQDVLSQILTGLQSEDDVAVLQAIMKLNSIQEVNEEILHELEMLAIEDENSDIRKDSQAVLDKLRSKPDAELSAPQFAATTPEAILNEILSGLKSSDAKARQQAIASLKTIRYSSEAIRIQLEKLALHDPEERIRSSAVAVLDLSIHRNVQQTLNKVDRGTRNILLREITTWEKFGLLQKQNAEIIRRRYDFDITPPAKPHPVPAQAAVAQPRAESIPASVAKPAPVAPPPKAMEPAGPRPTLMQTLLSETSIKIALYLGAFFVIASAVILGVLNEGARLPILIISTLIFGGLSLGIRKRLPQPSFTLFIVFSFLLPITADVIEGLLHFSDSLSAGYWVFISLFMAAIWMAGTWLYESRLFSITAFLSGLLAFLRIGDTFDAAPEFYAAMAGTVSLISLAGVWSLKKWRDADFSQPLFIAAQLVQIIVLASSISIFFIHLFDSSSPILWNLASIFTWSFAFVFFVISNILFPFVIFPWLATVTLLSIPWFLSAALDLNTTANTVLFFIWTLLIAAGSEITYHIEKTRNYSLPLVLVSILSAIITVATGFLENTTTGFLAALGITILYTILQILRARGWLWTFALLNFITAYFTFFTLQFVEKLNIFFGYQLLALSILFLLPDLFLRNDLKHNLHWRLPPRILGAIFTIWNFVVFAPAEEKPLINTAVVFLIYSVFYLVYSLRYDMAWIGYLATTALAISIVYGLNHFNLDLWMPVLSVLCVLYFFGGFALGKNERFRLWRSLLEGSGLILGTIISLTALGIAKPTAGWYVAVIAMLFIVEMYTRKESLFEIGAQILLPISGFMLLKDFKIQEISFILLTLGLTMLGLDMIFARTYKAHRVAEWPVKALGALLALTSSLILIGEPAQTAAIGFSILAVFFALYTWVQQKAFYGYVAAAYIPLAVLFGLNVLKVDAWLPALTGLVVLYFLIGLAIRIKEDWSYMLRNSALALGTIISFGALFTLKETGGWYAIVVGLLFAVEMYVRRNGLFEIGLPALFNIAAFLILHDFKINEVTYHLLAYSLVWLLSDLLAHLTFADPRILKWPVRTIGACLAIVNYGYLFFDGDATMGAVGFGVYTLLFLVISLLYRQQTLLYTFTFTLPLFVTFLFREFGVTKWIHPVIGIAAIYYGIGLIMRSSNRGKGWDLTLLTSGLGLATFVSIASPILGGLDAAIPVAIAATLWAVEAFTKKNAWLAFPANLLYLLAYFIILFELNQNEIQFFSIGAALLGLFQHYLLVRADSRTGAFITGMVSQLVLLGTTYIQMLSTQELGYFFVLFFQFLVVLTYGIVIRSRSLTFTPIVIIVLGVITVLYSAFKGLNTVVLIGCTGIIMLVFGIIAVLMRERITKLGERLSSWGA
jgi:hypothetical protein